MPFSYVPGELIQIEDVVTSSDTQWGDAEGLAKSFCTFIECEVNAKRLTNNAMPKPQTDS